MWFARNSTAAQLFSKFSCEIASGVDVDRLIDRLGARAHFTPTTRPRQAHTHRVRDDHDTSEHAGGLNERVNETFSSPGTGTGTKRAREIEGVHSVDSVRFGRQLGVEFGDSRFDCCRDLVVGRNESANRES